MKGRKRRPIRLFRFVAVILFLFLLGGIFHVWMNFKRTQMGYSLSQLKKEILEFEEHNRKLRLEMAFLKSPEHLEKRAIEELGLIHPLPQQIIYLP
ncbi:MAG: cell division protein FtsL [Deltaproteobacteria bacterium]|nr:MAG: cell division protein FtsL [Deltaproteobacteria bacterium]